MLAVVSRGSSECKDYLLNDRIFTLSHRFQAVDTLLRNCVVNRLECRRRAFRCPFRLRKALPETLPRAFRRFFYLMIVQPDALQGDRDLGNTFALPLKSFLNEDGAIS